MKVLVTIVLCIIFSTNTSTAQTIPYQKLDSLCGIINTIQAGVNEKFGATGTENQITFLKENFKVYSYNYLANQSYYLKENNQEYLAFNGDVDLSKVTGLTIHNMIGSSTLMMVALHFPKDYLKTQIIKNSEIVNTISPEYLEFYGKTADLSILSSTLFELTSELRIQKGLFTKAKLIEEAKGILNLNYEEFYAKYPNSLYAMQCKVLIEKKKEDEKILKIHQNYIYNLMNKYKFKDGLYLTEFQKYNPEISKLTNRKPSYYDNTTSYSNISLVGNPYPQGPFGLNIETYNGKINSYQIIIASSKNETEVISQYESFIADALKNLPKEYITSTGTFNTTLSVPGSGVDISFHVFGLNNWKTFSIIFTEQE